MSMKVYSAFRVKPEADVWAVLKDIHDSAERNVRESLRAFYRARVEEVDLESKEFRAARRTDPGRTEASFRLHLVDEDLCKKFKEAATSMQRSEYDLEVNLALTKHRTGFYLRAFCDNVSCLRGSLDFLQTHPDLEDFHYQNQTDRPRGVSEHAWGERKRIWDEMADKAGFFPYQLIVVVCSWGKFWRLNPWLELAQEFHLNPPTFPPREEILARPLRALTAVESVIAEPGWITVKTATSTATIEKSTKRAQRAQWLTRMGGKLKRHATLERAIDLVYLTYVNPSWRATIQRYQREFRATKRKKATRKRV